MFAEGNTRSIQLGVIGCGIAARELHWPAIQQIPDLFRISAVCNHTEPKARDFAKVVGGVPYHLDYMDLLHDDSVEAVLITLPIELNYRTTRDALQAGKHVLVEKPLAVNLAEAESMLQLEQTADRVVMVAENYRYRPTFQRVKEILHSGHIGEPYAAIWNIFSHMTTDNKFAQTNWRIHHKYTGGFITDAGIHNIAALRLLFGDFFSGSALIQTINPDIGKTDTFNFQFRMVNGISGQLNIFYTAHGISEDTLFIFGTSGTLQVQGNSIIFLATDNSRRKETVPDSGGFQEEYEDFYQAIRTGAKVRSTMQEAFEDLKVLLQALEAANSGQIVQL